MAQIKQIKSNKTPKEVNTNFENLPEQVPTDKKSKPLIFWKKRQRAGIPQQAPNPYGKPKVIKDGKCIK